MDRQNSLQPINGVTTTGEQAGTALTNAHSSGVAADGLGAPSEPEHDVLSPSFLGRTFRKWWPLLIPLTLLLFAAGSRRCTAHPRGCK